MQKVPLIRIERIARWVLGLAFVAAGLLKAIDPMGFAFSIARMQIFPKGAIGPAAIVLPWIEIVAGAALLGLPTCRSAALAILATLLVAFTAALAIVLARGTSTHCGCFGVDGGILGHPGVALARNVVLGGLAVLLATSSRRSGPASPA
jgi:uncharacterized membrane protein YphA (DoxX/SURF4 family)